MAEYIPQVNHYIDNNQFYNAMIEYISKCKLAKQNQQPNPEVPPYIAECIMKIATHLSYKPNFFGYSFKDECILDAIENCLIKVSKFNPEVSNNPFWYFTRISYNAFIRRILTERNQMYIKGKIVATLPFSVFDIQDQDQECEYTGDFIEILQEQGAYNDIVQKEDIRRAKKKINKIKTEHPSSLEDIFN